MLNKQEVKPSELLDILRKVRPQAYAHVVWIIRDCLRIITDTPFDKQKGCSVEMTTAANLKEKENGQ